MSDPIGQLMFDLDRDGHPSLPWVVEWSHNVEGAWVASADPLAMWRLACRTEAIVPSQAVPFFRALQAQLDTVPYAGWAGDYASVEEKNAQRLSEDGREAHALLGAAIQDAGEDSFCWSDEAVEKAFGVLAQRWLHLGFSPNRQASVEKAGTDLATVLRVHVAAPTFDEIMATAVTPRGL